MYKNHQTEEATTIHPYGWVTERIDVTRNKNCGVGATKASARGVEEAVLESPRELK